MRIIAGPKENYSLAYLMWVMQVGEPWCVLIGLKKDSHTIGPYFITLINSSDDRIRIQMRRFVWPIV